jgi:DNA-binding response OmpR family regulator
MAHRLLLVDDDEKLCRLLREYLEPVGYEVEVVHDGTRGLLRATSGEHAAVILDVMLPGRNGMEILREIRRSSTVPVLMLTALGGEPDRVAGLETGADDYLPKTSSPRELLARLRAVLRRSLLTQPKDAGRDETVSVGELKLDPGARRATLGRKPLTLTAIEYELLLSLARSAGRVKTREQLLLDVADRDFEGMDRSIDVHVSALRKKLGDDPRTPRFIETVRGVGYRIRRPGDPAAE